MRAIAIIGAVMLLGAPPVAAGEQSAAPDAQLAQGPSLVLVCRGGGGSRFDIYFNKNHYRQLCVFFKWHEQALGRNRPPPGRCGFIKRAPTSQEQRARLYCHDITRTVRIRRWPSRMRRRYQYSSVDAPYLAHLDNPRYGYALRVRSQGSSWKVLGMVRPRAKKRRKKRR